MFVIIINTIGDILSENRSVYKHHVYNTLLHQFLFPRYNYMIT